MSEWYTTLSWHQELYIYMCVCVCFLSRYKSLAALLQPVQSFLLKHTKKRMEPTQMKQCERDVYVKCSFFIIIYLFTYNWNLSDITNLIQQRMEQLIPNDPVALDTALKGCCAGFHAMLLPSLLGISLSTRASLERSEKMLGLSQGRHKYTIPPHRDNLSVLSIPPSPLKKKSIKLAL